MSKPASPLRDRLEKWVHHEPNTGCWLWAGPCGGGRSRYRILRLAGTDTNITTHRLAWQLFRGPIPDGMHVCHRCDTPECVNPDHLFLGTSFDNMRDKVAKGRDFSYGRGRTHCSRGHEYTTENTRRSGPRRHCRKCCAEYTAAYRARREGLVPT